jgi:SsrA-binding protein
VIALCKGRKLHDKREVLKKNDARREIDRAIKQRSRRV